MPFFEINTSGKFKLPQHWRPVSLVENDLQEYSKKTLIHNSIHRSG